MSQSLSPTLKPVDAKATSSGAPSVPVPNDLLSAAANGDEHAFELFYDQVAGMILGVAHAILPDPADAEEISQQILLELWRTAGRYSSDHGDAIVWAMTLAHRRTVDRLRSTQASGSPDTIAAVDGHRTRLFRRDSDTATVTEECGVLRRGVVELTESRYESVMLAYVHGLTYQQVGAALRISPTAAATRLRDTLIRLRECLDAAAPWGGERRPSR